MKRFQLLMLLILSFVFTIPAWAETKPAATPKAESADNKGRKVKYWVCPMDKKDVYKKPGKAKCGMEAVPVYEDEMPKK